MIEIEQVKAEIETKANVEQKMQRRSVDKLWAGKLQSEIAGPTQERRSRMYIPARLIDARSPP